MSIRRPCSGAARDAQRAGAAPLRVTLLMLCAALACLLAGPVAGASAHRLKHVCSAAPHGRAACMAERLLLGSETSPAPARAARQGRGAKPAGLENKKPYEGFLTPERLHAAYGLPAETAAGSTQTIAVVDAFNDPTAEADLAVYDKQFGLPECTSANGCFTKVNQEGKATPLPANEGGWAAEISIDVQMAHAICQSCRILLVETRTEEFSDLGAGVNAAVAAGATVVSNSYGEGESASYKTLAKDDYNHPGVPVLASSGDCGYINQACPARPAGADFPADVPTVVAVGGTSLSESAGVWTSTTWEEGGSGCSSLFGAQPWQSELAGFAASGCAGSRGVADVSAIGNPETGVDVYDSTPEEPGGPTGWGVWGGTSVASPIVAGEFGLAGGALGVAYPAATLYAHFGEADALYDVTSGINGKCAGATICNAAAGYDGPSGVGSPVGLDAFAVAGIPESVSAPTVTGIAEVGVELTEHHGSWSGAPTSYSYQWEQCGFAGGNCHPIAGATAATYTPGEAAIGTTLRVRETARNAVGPGSADSATVGPVTSDVPAITGLSSSSGITGSQFVIEGSALDTATSVSFGNLGASFKVLSAQALEVTVPDGAKSAKLSVTTAHGTVTSKAKFTVTFAITSFKPGLGAAGTKVTIKGVGFSAGATVAFGGVKASEVTVGSSKKIVALVPAGALAGPITVTNTASPAGTVSSAGSFTP